eukprot:12655693-Alexandrium_andersonii.AAC.1
MSRSGSVDPSAAEAEVALGAGGSTGRAFGASTASAVKRRSSPAAVRPRRLCIAAVAGWVPEPDPPAPEAGWVAESRWAMALRPDRSSAMSSNLNG